MKNKINKIHLENLQLEHNQLRNAQREWKYIEKIDFSDKNAVPFHLHIGMRTFKTVLAVFICGLIGSIIGQPPLFSMFAAILCTQNKTDDTIKAAFNRFIGTLVGGFYSVITVYTCWLLGISDTSFLYYSILSAILLAVITTTLYIRKPTTTGLSCIVFIAISLSDFNGLNPLTYAIWRTIDTLIGIGIIVILELIFPYHPNKVENTADTKIEPKVGPT